MNKIKAFKTTILNIVSYFINKMAINKVIVIYF